jgi:hypothetical protein
MVMRCSADPQIEQVGSQYKKSNSRVEQSFGVSWQGHKGLAIHLLPRQVIIMINGCSDD